MQLNIKQFKKWITALDSGKYQQGKYSLQNKNGYCCLGVACSITIPTKFLVLDIRGRIRGHMPSEQPLAPPWLKLINEDFFDKTGKSLDALNDDQRYTFPEIATLLELVYIHKILN
jgi:hypothetical protein